MVASNSVKLTLLLDRDLIAEAKKFAEENGTSLSRLVAAYFRGLVTHGAGHDVQPGDGPLVRWILERGPEPPVTEEDIWEDMARKHLLP